MIVGEAPGRTEIKQGSPFVGPSGARLNGELAGHGWTRDAIYITNAFKGDVGPGDPDPTDEQLNDHFEILIDEIGRVQPKIIMAVGRFAARALLPNLLPGRKSPTL